MSIHLSCHNIHYGFGIDGKFDCGRIAATLGDADIIALQEVTRGLPANEAADMVAVFTTLFPEYFTAVGMPVDVDAGSTVQNGRAFIRRFRFGNMILSRYPIASIRHHLLPWRRTAGRINMQRGALETVIATPAGTIGIINVHLDHVDARERLHQIASLRDIIAGYREHGGAITGLSEFGYTELPIAEGIVAMGDFNMWPDSPEYRSMIGDGDDVLVDISTADSGHGSHNPNESSQRSRLDYVFADPWTARRISGFQFDRKADGSDHLPMHFQLD